MFFGKKEQKGLPDLPAPQSFLKKGIISEQEESYKESLDEQALPAFPDSPSHNKFSEAAIKEAVNSEKSKEDFLTDFPENPVENTGNIVEMEEWNPKKDVDEEFRRASKSSQEDNIKFRATDKKDEISEPMEESYVKTSFGSKKKEQDVFVKIDKFYSAKRSLNEIRRQLQNIEEMIKKVRETKIREEQELSVWERDMLQIKTRLKDVTENIFEKVR